jgi:hypothetical protein
VTNTDALVAMASGASIHRFIASTTVMTRPMFMFQDAQFAQPAEAIPPAPIVFR